MKRYLLIVLMIAFIMGCVATIAYGTYYYVYKNYFRPNNQIVSAFNENELNLVVEDEIVNANAPPLVIDEEILLTVEVIRKYFDPYINWDEKTGKVTITTKDRVIRMKTESLEALINDNPVELDIPVVVKDDNIYVPIEFLADMYKIDISFIEKNGVIIIDYKNNIRQIAHPLISGAVVRRGRSIREPVVKKYEFEPEGNEDNEMKVFKEYDRWLKVRTSDGIIGYMQKKEAVIIKSFMTEIPRDEAKPPWQPGEGKISLVWEQMYGKRPDLSKIKTDQGMDVVSPTWFHLKDAQGNLRNHGDKLYVDWAHENGLVVWALISNSFDAGMTHEFLSNMDARDNLIRQLLAYASLYNLDGINIDFENINIEDKDLLTQFVRELAPFLREQGLVVSMDVGVPGGSDNYSRCYDLVELGKAVDYIMLMAYDQHWAASPVAGSVAQISWVEAKLKRTLQMVPREKLMLGLPFYIRVWTEKTSADGRIEVSSKAYSMGYVERLIQEKKLSVEWDEVSGQYYTEYEEDDAVVKIWVEDEKSINLKSALAHKYKLAGTAAWSRGLEKEGIWSVLEENLKNTDNYFEWKDKNAAVLALK